jgi:hypothetical protein
LKKGINMSENNSEAVEKPKRARKPRATEKAAEDSKIVKDVSVVAADRNIVNDEGQKVIAGPPAPKPTRKSNLNSEKESKTVASRAADSALAKKPVEDKKEAPKKDEKVALWSNKNIRWTGTGTLVKGYNIVTKEAADKWLKKQGIRKATPEEVATYYGK